MVRRAIALSFGLVLLGGCGSAAESPGEPTGTSASAPESSTGPVGGNGTVYTSTWGSELTIAGHPVNGDGSVGPGTELLSQEASDADFAAVIDGVGADTLSANLTNYWSTELLLHTDGQVVSEVPAPDWCGGEGLTYAVCTLLDDTRVARTTSLGRDPVLGDGPEAGSILVSSLKDGSTLGVRAVRRPVHGARDRIPRRAHPGDHAPGHNRRAERPRFGPSPGPDGRQHD